MTTTEIINKFVESIDTDNEYTLAELMQLLHLAYGNDEIGAIKPKKVKTDKAVKPVKEPKAKKTIKTDHSDDDKVKVKRVPSAYNNFVKEKIVELKAEQPETPAKELMGLAAKLWKDLNDEEKATYKSA